jgi:hypothetical protein
VRVVRGLTQPDLLGGVRAPKHVGKRRLKDWGS